MLTKSHKEKIKKLCELYAAVKESIIYAEEIDDMKEVNFNAISELRHAFDHLMRVHAVEYNINSDVPSNYVDINIDKCYGHIYRAGYDTLDMLCITLRFKIGKMMSGFSTDTITHVLPEYFREIKVDLSKIDKEITDKRRNKDVGYPNFKNFMDYAGLAKRLRKHNDVILENYAGMNDYQWKKRAEEGTKKMSKIIIAITILIAAYFLGLSSK